MPNICQIIRANYSLDSTVALRTLQNPNTKSTSSKQKDLHFYLSRKLYIMYTLKLNDTVFNQQYGLFQTNIFLWITKKHYLLAWPFLINTGRPQLCLKDICKHNLKALVYLASTPTPGRQSLQTEMPGSAKCKSYSLSSKPS